MINILNSIEDETERFNAFVEINAKEQVYNLAKTSIVQGAWKNGQDLMLHGWVYGLNSGFVTDLNVNISSNDELDEVYQLNCKSINNKKIASKRAIFFIHFHLDFH